LRSLEEIITARVTAAQARKAGPLAFAEIMPR
jgi:hypothetical protein